MMLVSTWRIVHGSYSHLDGFPTKETSGSYLSLLLVTPDNFDHKIAILSEILSMNQTKIKNPHNHQISPHHRLRRQFSDSERTLIECSFLSDIIIINQRHPFMKETHSYPGP
ncbi:hypothetical protein BDQ94DRAFT_135123 [Aspergillus welwitschiae]|uniref:Uncharacterized protein n=1 Tax=Aspergillus welwitschiae TaxID=1341132 RepID=A0A3F3QGN7_9EURO|nr:hypothetical protein BDQ94DRAFT_135123 [Aspergillus welwitschiae]RDH37836.1 hypothetical protein BDQ94DRAFT_135123 [Aspergillus welwitschiae]